MHITPHTAPLQSDTRAATSGQVAASQRQDVSTNTPNNEDQVSLSDQSKQQRFMDDLMDAMLANRLGLDREKIEELKEKIEQLEGAIESMKNKGSLSPKQQESLNMMEEELQALKDKLEELIREAAERAAKEESQNKAQDPRLTRYKDILNLTNI